MVSIDAIDQLPKRVISSDEKLVSLKAMKSADSRSLSS